MWGSYFEKGVWYLTFNFSVITFHLGFTRSYMLFHKFQNKWQGPTLGAHSYITKILDGCQDTKIGAIILFGDF